MRLEISKKGGDTMTVRAKFKVDAKEYTFNGVEEQVNIKMTPVYPKASGDKTENEHENRTFWKYTPGGELRMSTINKTAADYFELGKEYYLDFTKAE